MKRLLLTGFQPFGGQAVNPSWECAAAMPETLSSVAVVRACLPVDWVETPRALNALIDRETPDAVLCLGQAGGRTAVTVERIAVNLMESAAPDNAGLLCAGAPVIPGGPDGLFITLPHAAMLAALRRAGIPAEYSFFAGTYLCNCALYHALYRARTDSNGMRAGFVHLPYLDGQTEGAFSLPKETLCQAVFACCTAVCEGLFRE